MNETIKENNRNVVTDTLSNKEILDSYVLQSKLEIILVDGVDFNDIKTKPESVLIVEDEVKKILKY